MRTNLNRKLSIDIKLFYDFNLKAAVSRNYKKVLVYAFSRTPPKIITEWCELDISSDDSTDIEMLIKTNSRYGFIHYNPTFEKWIELLERTIPLLPEPYSTRLNQIRIDSIACKLKEV